jgi:Protein of unknown function (DUF2949)
MSNQGQSNAFIHFLQRDLQLSLTSIELARRYCQDDSSLLPIVLWQFGFVSLPQLEQIFNWMGY